MRRRRGIALLAVLLAVAAGPPAGAADPGRVLVVTDELEPMQALAESLRDAAGMSPLLVGQRALPDDWSAFSAVLVYVHRELLPETEDRAIGYTRSGGRLLVLHHSISSGKVANAHWFDFLGIALPGAERSAEPAEPGGHYAWHDPVALEIVNLAPEHYVTSHGIDWPETTLYASSDRPSLEREYPSFTLEPAEAYVNHHFTDGRRKTVLLGFKYRDDRNGVLFMQDREGWLKPAGDGWIAYLQMGHFAEEWRHPIVTRLVLNAIRWRPGAAP